MAVVFISPKQRQNMFFLGITVLFLLFLAVVFFGVFVSKPQEASIQLTFNRPKINIDTSVFDTDQFKNLQPFPAMETQYSYKATTKDKKEEAGFISATSIDEAKAILTAQGLSVSEIQETAIGRDNPFTPYNQISATPSPATKLITPTP